MIVVTGASGKVGGGIAAELLKEKKKIRVVARHAEKLKALAEKGAEIAEGDLSDAHFLVKAFSGAEAAFVLIPPNLSAENFPLYQDKVGDATTKALREAGVKHIVFLSSVGGELPSGTGPVAGLHRQEERLNALPGANVLNLRPGYFMENFIGLMPMLKQMGSLGGATVPDVRIPMIATQDIARAAAPRLAKRDFSGKSVVDLLGQRDLSMSEVAAVLGKAIGKPDLKYIQFPPADAIQGMVGMGISRSVAEGFAEMSQAFNEKRIPQVKRNPGNTTPTSIEEFAPVFASAYKAS